MRIGDFMRSKYRHKLTHEMKTPPQRNSALLHTRGRQLLRAFPNKRQSGNWLGYWSQVRFRQLTFRIVRYLPGILPECPECRSECDELPSVNVNFSPRDRCDRSSGARGKGPGPAI